MDGTREECKLKSNAWYLHSESDEDEQVGSSEEKVRMRGKSFRSKVAVSRALLKRSFRESVLDEKSVREPRVTAIEMPIKLRAIHSPVNPLFK